MWTKCTKGGGSIMKLISCYVSSFGKLKDFSYDFNDNLNVIKQDNGWGKSTFAYFIKSIFYGLNGSNKKSVSDNERIKFKPWNSTEKFGGYVIFESKGKNFKLERFFGNKESEDTVVLTDLVTGVSFLDEKEVWGNRIFQIDEEGFLSTTYFSEQDFKAKSNTSLTQKFNNISEVDDGENFDKAIKEISEKAKSYKYSGNRGIIPSLKGQISELDETIERTKSLEKTTVKIKDEIKILENKINEKSNEINVLGEKVKIEGRQEAIKLKKERFESLRKQKEEVQKEIENIDNIFNGKTPDETTLGVLKECVTEMQENERWERFYEDDILAYEESKTQTKNKRKPVFMVGLISLFALLTSGIISLFFDITLSIIIFAIWAIVFIFCVFFITKKPLSNFDNNNVTNDKKAKLLERKKIKETYLIKISSFLSDYNLNKELSLQESVAQISDLINKHQFYIKSLKNIDAELEKIKYDRDLLDVLPETAQISSIPLLEKAQQEFRILSNEISEKRSALTKYLSQSEKLLDYISEKDRLKEELKKSENHLFVLTQALHHLSRADENLKIKYRAPLEQSLNRYLKLISNNESLSLNVDIDLNVTVTERDGTKVSDFYSKGTQNLFEICKRFALTDILFNDEKPFIILDDPFYNLDECKVQASLNLIKELSKEYQIIYCTCHSSRVC